jgi:hypothetical protein
MINRLEEQEGQMVSSQAKLEHTLQQVDASKLNTGKNGHANDGMGHVTYLNKVC